MENAPINPDSGTVEFPPASVAWSPVAGLMMMLLFLVVQVFIAMLDLPFAAGNQLGVQVAASNVVMLVIIFGCLLWWTGGTRRARLTIGLRWPGLKKLLLGPLKPLLIGVPVLIIWAVLQGLVLQHFDIRPPRQRVVQWLQEQAAGGIDLRVAFFIFLAVVVAPLTEELVFRGIVYLPMRERYGPLRAAIVVSLIFAGIHAYWAGLGHLFILALIFTWLMESTRTMLWPIMAHGVHNGAMVVLMLLAGSQTG